MLPGAFHAYAAAGAVFREEAVVRLDAEGNAPVHADAFPAPEPVQLGGVRAPGAGLHHQIGGALRLSGNLPEHGLVAAQGGIAEEELDEEGFLLAGLRVV